mmetsp:Transcript_23105/g.60082  ORF Transcript_23105/g.60082 Transcript_23105/m.60082 type:complete len:213 (+) Transcript_23105:749-1387(+)
MLQQQRVVGLAVGLRRLEDVDRLLELPDGHEGVGVVRQRGREQPGHALGVRLRAHAVQEVLVRAQDGSARLLNAISRVLVLDALEGVHEGLLLLVVGFPGVAVADLATLLLAGFESIEMQPHASEQSHGIGVRGLLLTMREGLRKPKAAARRGSGLRAAALGRRRRFGGLLAPGLGHDALDVLRRFDGARMGSRSLNRSARQFAGAAAARRR